MTDTERIAELAAEVAAHRETIAELEAGKATLRETADRATYRSDELEREVASLRAAVEDYRRRHDALYQSGKIDSKEMCPCGTCVAARNALGEK